MAGNIFSDAGLVARGFNEAAIERNRIADLERTNAFNTQMDPIRVRAAQVGLDEANMTMDELRRKRANEAAMRAAVSGAGPDRLGVTQAAAEAARTAGDRESYDKLSASIPTLQREGWSELVRGAMMGVPPEQAVANFNRVGAGRIAAAEWGKDPKTGDILMNLTDAGTGQKQVMNATKLYELMNPQKSEVHARGQFGNIVTTPGRATQVIEPPASAAQRFAPNTGVEKLTYKDGEGNERQYLWNIVKEKWEGEAPPAGAQQVGSIRRDLPLLKEAEQTLRNVPGMFVKTNPENPLDTQGQWTPNGLAVLSRTERLMLGNKGLPATAIIEIATQGKPKRADNGDIVVEHNGRYYPLGGQGGTEIPRPPAPVAPPTRSFTYRGNIPAEDMAAANAVFNAKERGQPLSVGVNRRMADEEKTNMRDMPGLEIAAPQPAPQAVATTQPSGSTAAEKLILAGGLVALYAELEKRYPPTPKVHPRTGRASSYTDHPEIQKLKQKGGADYINYANRLLAGK